MTAATENVNRERIRVTERGTCVKCNFSGWPASVVVNREREIGARKARQQSILDHRLCTTTRFLGWLAEHDQRTAPGLLAAGHDSRGSHPRCHV